MKKENIIGVLFLLLAILVELYLPGGIVFTGINIALNLLAISFFIKGLKKCRSGACMIDEIEKD